MTDARADPRVVIVAEIAPDLHAPIRYPAAVTRSGGPGAAAFVDYLSTPQAQAQLAAFGFAPPPP